MYTREISEYAAAKINLSLDVVGQREDGYHELSMIMQSLKLCDKVKVSVKLNHCRSMQELAELVANGSADALSYDINVDCEAIHVPDGPSNIAWKATAAFMKNLIERLSGSVSDDSQNITISIDISKKIPVAAGLAGGSADAAAVLRALNKAFEPLAVIALNNDGEVKAVTQNKAGFFTVEKLCEIGATVGADVPFCIVGGLVHAQGIGDVLTPLQGMTGIHVLLVKPRIGIATPTVYKEYDEIAVSDEERPDNDKLIGLLADNNIQEAAVEMKNVLECVSLRQHPVIVWVKEQLRKFSPDAVLMSGSGPTVFALFAERKRAVDVFKVMKKQLKYDKQEYRDTKFDVILTEFQKAETF